ncbi:Eukaryotic translation initiation factor eIF2A [Babesia microti strain RI]|uniref:Eukaryotic translation initiation factor 2A n=1 Tax=Babesia microti (strain RI) TaxID=1133968 RepID=A0A1R4ABF3_BABMR|nr:Eukaryotic translation initiation factor eIF2A [Babesia microti strain RI]SJK86300.1 Eukaryotic translation initiation factor eIF2A [Babesia microti strain RI]|eukprot:XP_021338475.1 Eukaryotic translation initiation factor eIF2A [Babesia microti strain RI]
MNLEFLALHKRGLTCYSFNPNYSSEPNNKSSTENKTASSATDDFTKPRDRSSRISKLWYRESVTTASYNSSGEKVYIQDSYGFHVLDSTTGDIKSDIPIEGKFWKIKFSPRDTVTCVWTAYSENNQDNVHLLNRDGEVYQIFTIKHSGHDHRLPHWNEDETVSARVVFNGKYELKVFSGPMLLESELIRSVPLQNVDTTFQLAISPVNRKGESFIAFFTPKSRGSPASITILSCAKEKEDPILKENLPQADEVTFYWNKTASSLLVKAHIENDMHRSSYYGGSALYLIKINKSAVKQLAKFQDGLVHDILWSKTTNEFFLCKGPMPSHLTLHNGTTGDEVADYGKSNRNTLRICPFGRFLLVGGFGNLSGGVDIWDTKTLKKLSTTTAPCSVSCEFTSDARHFVTATTNPRMRVDNCIKIYNYWCELLEILPFDELYFVNLRPLSHMFESRDPSPDRQIKVQQTKVYRAPGSTGQVSKILEQRNISITKAKPVDRKPVSNIKSVPGADDLMMANVRKKMGKKSNY